MEIKGRVFIVTGASSGSASRQLRRCLIAARRSPCSLAAPMRYKNWHSRFEAACLLP
jgi:hypothetical protein